MSRTNDNNVVHRPGGLKQQNKSFKTGRHRSQHEIKRSAKGRVAEKKHCRSLKRLNVTKKCNRVNTATQIRKQKVQINREARQTIGAIDGVPQLITLIPLSLDINLFSIVELLTKSIEDKRSTDFATECGARIFTSTKLRSKFCFLTPNATNLENVVDAANMCDTIIFVISSSNGISIEGDYLMDLIDQHCRSPNIIYSFISPSNHQQMSTTSSRLTTSRNFEKFIQKKFANAKLVSLNNEQDGQRLLTKLAEQKLVEPTKRCLRPYLFAQSFSYENPQASTSTLKITGFIRGIHLSANQLVYLPTLGTFQLQQIEQHQFQQQPDGTMKTTVEQTFVPQPELQCSLQNQPELDPMNINEEQTWPTAQELQLAQKQQHQFTKRVPKGTSAYQAAWIVSDEEEIDDDEQEETNTNNTDIHKSLQQQQQQQQQEEEEEEEMDELVINPNNYDEKCDLDEEKQTLNKLKEAKLDEEFPDEIDTPQHIPARIRFQKYRGLKSFRTTKWDPKENLPTDYGRIYQFPHFRSMVKQIAIEQEQQLKQHQHNSAEVNHYVTISVKDVPVQRFQTGFHLFVTGLLPHEQCLSVLNIVLNRTNDTEVILKSKERLIFHVGYRRFESSPIYSQHTNGDKHKFERYFRARQTLVATCFGPITYPPASVLAFKQYSDGRQELVATGSLLSVNPDRLILKRVVLSGHPLKIQQKSAVARYMFFSPEDVNWFKPIELRTRWGRRGHIKESLGTHGHMKCQFDGILKSQDTILMNLYKRVYPKWTYQPLSLQHDNNKRQEEEEEEMQ